MSTPETFASIVHVLFVLTLIGVGSLLALSHLAPGRLARWNSVPWAFQLRRAPDTELHCTLYALYHGTRWGQVSHWLFALDVLAWFALLWSVHPALVAVLLAALALLATRLADRALALALGLFWIACAALAPLVLAAIDHQIWWLELAVIAQGLLRVAGHFGEPIPPLLGDGADAFRKLGEARIGLHIPLVLVAGYVSEVTAGLPWGLIRVQGAWLVDRARREGRHWEPARAHAARMRAGGFAAFPPTAAMLAERPGPHARSRISGSTLTSLSVFALLPALAADPGPAHARQVGEVDVPDAVEIAGRRLTLNGAALYEATVFAIDIYVAALWLGSPTSRPAEASRCEGPVEFDFFWLYEPSLDQLVEPWRKTMRANAGAELSRFEARIEQLIGALRAPLEGERWRFVYEPGAGMTLRIDETPVITIEGQDFCRLFIGGHVGPTADEGVRRGLLGKTARP